MNKKAWIGIMTVVFIGITISIIIYAYFHPYKTTDVMGEQQSAIMEAYSVGEQARRYSSDAAELAAQQAINKLGNISEYSNQELLTKFEPLFEEEFRKYLLLFKLPVYKDEDSILPKLGTEEAEEPKTLYDVVKYNKKYKIENNKIIIEGFPVIEEVPDTSNIYSVDEETGEETNEIEDVAEITYTVESAIIISSEKYTFEYVLDPYFRIELDIS